MAALPLDIIVDVFAKLHANSVCRLKCLAKSFLAFITNPRFVRLHQTQNHNRDKSLLVRITMLFSA